MSVIILSIMLLSYLLIATEHVTKINKSAVAVFVGTLFWVLYICYGNGFVSQNHAADYADFLGGAIPTSSAVKQYISQSIFLKHVGRASEIAVFLLATMTIVEILTNNGCFDFLSQLMQTRKSRHLLWIMAGVTILLSVNLDNLTTTIMMLTIMHGIIPNRRQRMVFGAAIVVSANLGGAMTVIGDAVGLALWNREAVTASGYSLTLVPPLLVAWVFTIYMLGRMLPERIDHSRVLMPYRGDDTRLNNWQRLTMLVVGIGGLWFIPTFHNITKLSPFLGAMCVLAVLWIVNEVMNHRLINSDYMAMRRTPSATQYGTIQMILYVMGIMLAVGAVEEIGLLDNASDFLRSKVDNVWIMGLLSGLMSTVVDSFATAMTFTSLFSVESSKVVADNMSIGIYDQLFQSDGLYWKIIPYCCAIGGNLLAIGTTSGLALLKMEHMHVGWFFKNVGLKCIVGGLLGLATMWLIIEYFYI